MGFEWKEFIQRLRAEILDQWVFLVKTQVSPNYSARPVEELRGTVGQALDGYTAALVYGDHEAINGFIGEIARFRLTGGFSINDVLKAFELFRNVVTPLLLSELPPDQLIQSLVRLNDCMTYTTCCFSEFFQHLNKQDRLEYMHRLEADIKTRTSELLESERKYRTLVNEINDGYVVLQEGLILFVNPAFCDMHGYAAEEMLGERFELFIDPSDRRNVARLCQGEGRNGGGRPPFEYLRLSQNGKSLPTEITVKSACYGHSRSIVGICRDITERVQMAAKMRESERMAYIGRITASLSHEIRNPLSSVKLNLQILKKNLTLEGNDHRRLDISVREVQRLECILEELLDFAKPLSLNRSPCNLNRILPACIELVDGKLEEKHLTACISLDNTLPEIFADTHKLEQAIINLLLNAVEACEANARIWVTSRFNDGYAFPKAEFCVENEGVIPSNVLPEIFKPFFTTKLKGTGLGLTNVKRVVDAHGGCVSVERKETGRTSFLVRLPAEGTHG